MAQWTRRYLDEGTEMSNGQVVEESGWYLLIWGQWCWDEESQEES